jgi:hypothetical protein
MEDDMKTKELVLRYNGLDFFLKVADGEMVNLTDVWRSAGTPRNQSPKDWIRSTEATKFIESLSKKLKVENSHLLRIERGRSGGTFAHWQVATEYAGYLSPALRILVNNIFRERIQETIDPELGITRSRKRATSRWLDGGKSEEWIAERIKGIDERNEFTSTLGTHGVSGKGYGVCTNAIYIPVLQGAAADVRKRMNLPEKANIRDALDERSLASIKFAETLARLNIKAADAYGVESCSKEANRAGEAVKVALLMAKEEPQRRSISR